MDFRCSDLIGVGKSVSRACLPKQWRRQGLGTITRIEAGGKMKSAHGNAVSSR